MKIAFWGSEKECGIAANMTALASYLVCHRGYRVTIFDLSKEPCRIAEYFPGKHRKYAKEYIETLIEKGLYYVPRPFSKQIMERVECNMDIVFLNLANRTDREARQLMKTAETLVVNLKQEEKSFDTFFAKYANLSARTVLLVGNYLEDTVCNMDYLKEKYLIAEETFAVISFNPEFQLVCENGQLAKYMRRRKNAQMTERKRRFIQDIENALQIIFEQTKKEMAH